MDFEKLLYTIGNKSELFLDRMKLRWREKLGFNRNIQILPYTTYGRHDMIHLRGRVMYHRPVEISDSDTVWKNLLHSYRRLASLEIAGAKLRTHIAGTEHFFTSDEDGYFEFTLPLNEKLTEEELWHHPVIELLESPVPFDAPVTRRARVMTPPKTASFGVISDIDDTILTSDATNLFKAAYLTFFRNAYSRLPFPGVSALYRSLQKGFSGEEFNPLFYVSSSPWNLYDLLIDFFEINEIPEGPVILKDYGFTHKKIFTESHHVHKPKAIRNILNTYPQLPFILIGDSGQHDPEIYAGIAKEFPGRIKAIYIRDVTGDVRDAEVVTIARDANTEMLLVADSITAARHAEVRGLVAPGTSDAIALNAAGASDASDPALEEAIEQEAVKEVSAER